MEKKYDSINNTKLINKTMGKLYEVVSTNTSQCRLFPIMQSSVVFSTFQLFNSGSWQYSNKFQSKKSIFAI